MGKKKAVLLAVVVAFLIGGTIGYLNNWFIQPSKQEFILDKEGILSRGSLRVAVDNNSSSFYIYRGRRMGYEYELLLDLGKELGVQIEFVVVSDIDEAFTNLEEGKVDLIAMNVTQNAERESFVSFTESLGTISTVLVGRKKVTSWDSLGKDTVVVRKGALYRNQLEQVKDSLRLEFTILEVQDHEETLLDRVYEQELRWTVAEKNVAQTNATYYDELQLGLEVSKEEPVTWALRSTSTNLLEAVNSWLVEKEGVYSTYLCEIFFEFKKSI